MIEKIKASLVVLEGQLQMLWEDYLKSKPNDWLHDLNHVAGELAEARQLRDEIGGLRAHIGCIRHTLERSHHLDPVRKEN